MKNRRHEHLSNLERKGYVARLYNESRAIRCLVDPRVIGATGAAPEPQSSEAA